MKLPLWMLALPWAVAVSTTNAPRFCGDLAIVDEYGNIRSGCDGYPKYANVVVSSKTVISCGDRESCLDMAYALN